MDTILMPKDAEKFYCEICDFKCSKKSNYNKHILTRKHQRTYNGLTNADKNSPKIAKFECDC